MRYVYFGLALVGAVVPYVFFMQHFAAEGTSLDAFVRGLFANGAAGGFATDVLVSSVVFWVFLWRQGASRIWAYVLVNLLIGLSCALPLYLAISGMQDEAA